MQQIKFFKAVENDLDQLQREINGWLKGGGVKVVQIFGNIAPQTPSKAGGSGLSKSNFSPSDVLVAVLYETAE